MEPGPICARAHFNKMAEEEEQIVEQPEEEEEEDPVDHQEVLKEKCAELPKCAKLQEVLDECNERVSSKSSTTEDCTQELFDFLHCVEHCVAKNLLDKLK